MPKINEGHEATITLDHKVREALARLEQNPDIMCCLVSYFLSMSASLTQQLDNSLEDYLEEAKLCWEAVQTQRSVNGRRGALG
jgi:hypothetical protein